LSEDELCAAGGLVDWEVVLVGGPNPSLELPRREAMASVTEEETAFVVAEEEVVSAGEGVEDSVGEEDLTMTEGEEVVDSGEGDEAVASGVASVVEDLLVGVLVGFLPVTAGFLLAMVGFLLERVGSALATAGMDLGAAVVAREAEEAREAAEAEDSAVVEEASDTRVGADSTKARMDTGILRMAHRAALVGMRVVEGTVEVGLMARVVGINGKAVGTTTGTQSECVIEREFFRLTRTRPFAADHWQIRFGFCA